MTMSSLATMTANDLLKLQSDVATALSKRLEIDKAEATIAELAQKWEAKAAEFNPKTAAPTTVANGNGHHKPVSPQVAKAAKPARKRTSPAKGSVLPPKYKLGEQGWSGRGKQPRWLSERIAAGAKIEDFRVPA